MAQQACGSSMATKAELCAKPDVCKTPVRSKFGVHLLSSKGSGCCACAVLSTDTGPELWPHWKGLFGHNIYCSVRVDTGTQEAKRQWARSPALPCQHTWLRTGNLAQPPSETELKTLSPSRVRPAGALTKASLWGGDLASNLGC